MHISKCRKYKTHSVFLQRMTYRVCQQWCLLLLRICFAFAVARLQLLLALALPLLPDLLLDFSSEKFFALCGCVERKVEIRFQVAQRFYCLLFPLFRSPVLARSRSSLVRSYVCSVRSSAGALLISIVREAAAAAAAGSIVPKKKLQALFGSIRQRSRFNKTRQHILDECNSQI